MKATEYDFFLNVNMIYVLLFQLLATNLYSALTRRDEMTCRRSDTCCSLVFMGWMDVYGGLSSKPDGKEIRFTELLSSYLSTFDHLFQFIHNLYNYIYIHIHTQQNI